MLLPGDCDDLTTSDEDQNMSESNVIPFFPDLPRTVRFTRLRKRKADLAPVERTTYHFDCRCVELKVSELEAVLSV